MGIKDRPATLVPHAAQSASGLRKPLKSDVGITQSVKNRNSSRRT